MALIKQTKKATYVDQPLKLDRETIREINEYCKLVGITTGREGLRSNLDEKITKAEEKREFFIQEAIKIVLDLEKENIEKMKEEKKK